MICNFSIARSIDEYVMGCWKWFSGVLKEAEVNSHTWQQRSIEANPILERIKKGEKFSNIAKEVSQCPSGKRGGARLANQTTRVEKETKKGFLFFLRKLG